MRDARNAKRTQPDLAVVLARIRERAVEAAHRTWPGLAGTLDSLLPRPLDPMALLPIATGRAAGGEIDALVPIAAAILLADCALRIVDDCMDRDSPHALHEAIGAGRAINAAMALSATACRELVHAQVPPERLERLREDYFRAFADVCAGQDRDASPGKRTLEGYKEIVRQKTVAAYRFAAYAGARAASSEPDAIARCSECGEQLGWMAQLLDDLEALWFPVAGGIEIEQLTFPMLIGLTLADPGRAELKTACSATPVDRARVCRLLDGMDTRSHLMSLALDHRDRAIAALGGPLHPEGAEILRTWLDWLLRDAARLVDGSAHPVESKR